MGREQILNATPANERAIRRVLMATVVTALMFALVPEASARGRIRADPKAKLKTTW